LRHRADELDGSHVWIWHLADMSVAAANVRF